MAGCSIDGTREELCRNSSESSRLKLVSMIVILISSAAGILSPVVFARLFARKPVYANALLVIKCFAAGVILSTSLVHVLPNGFDALADCKVASRHPWRDFPFAGFVSLIGALLALLVDVAASSHVTSDASKYVRIGLEEVGKGEGKQNCHGHGHGGEEAIHVEMESLDEEDRLMKLKQRVVSQVLEIGIIFHSVIIGMTMGMSQNNCTIRPLIAAIAFHQIFEGLGLGGCIAQAGFGGTTVGCMCLMFSVTTPAGILLGMLVFRMTGYDDGSRNALILEGLLGSLSAGILLYMALVDLIAVDFFHNKAMASSPRLKKVSFTVLVAGSTSMSIIALWA